MLKKLLKKTFSKQVSVYIIKCFLVKIACIKKLAEQKLLHVLYPGMKLVGLKLAVAQNCLYLIFTRTIFLMCVSDTKIIKK